MPAWRHPNGHAQTKKMIAKCAEVGAGIDGLPDAPTFRFTPVPPSDKATSFTNGDPSWHCQKPSKRGSVLCGRDNYRKLKNWSPALTSLDTMYEWPMAGDSRALTEARKEYAAGRPEALRQWLADQANKRRLSQQREKECEAA